MAHPFKRGSRASLTQVSSKIVVHDSDPITMQDCDHRSHASSSGTKNLPHVLREANPLLHYACRQDSANLVQVVITTKFSYTKQNHVLFVFPYKDRDANPLEVPHKRLSASRSVIHTCLGHYLEVHPSPRKWVAEGVSAMHAAVQTARCLGAPDQGIGPGKDPPDCDF